MNIRLMSLTVRLWVVLIVVAIALGSVATVYGQAQVPPGVTLEEEPQITLTSVAQVYAWPNQQTPALGQLPAGSVVPVNGRTPASDWWRIDYPGAPGGNGWISGSVAQANASAVNVTAIRVIFVTATPVPTPTQLPCQLNFSYVADLTIPDGMLVGPGVAFQKVWRMRNSGNCLWPLGTELIFQEEEQMGAPGSVAVPPINPGETIDVRANMVAPRAPGRYRGIWQMRTPAGDWFGDRITVVITVSSALSTATPVPPPAPVPPSPPQPSSISFWADRTRVSGSECTTIYWSASNVQAVYLEYNDKSYGVAGNSSQEVCPSRDGKTYKLRVIMPDGRTEIRELRISIDESQEVKIDMWADDEDVEVGQCTHIRWETENTVKVEFYDGDDWNLVNRNDWRQVCPDDRTTYKIEVEDIYGSEHDRSVTVDVHNAD